jgi:ABC-type polysaccharide/polyol phosphate transport system ATPase subunit
MSSGYNTNGQDGGQASIRLEGVSLHFRKYADRHPMFKKAVIDTVFHRTTRPAGTYPIFSDLNLRVEHGERLGVVGANGAGKSTLLKLICGVYYPSAGALRIVGRIAPVIELGAGFMPEMSGVENIFLNGALLGFGSRAMAAKVDRILDFAGLQDVAQTPVKYYSTGMLLRLAFAVATDVDPEILLVDEVFAAGDAEFIGRAKARMTQLVDASHVAVLVSHDLDLIRQMCTRAVWLDRGRVACDGDPEDVCRAYQLHAAGAAAPAASA